MLNYSTSALLDRGLLPLELPPAFHSRGLGPCWAALSASDRPRPTQTGQLLRYSLARSGQLRRQLSIPHPLLHAQLLDALDQHKALWLPLLDRPPLSTSTPVSQPQQGRRALGRRLAEEALLEKRAWTRATSRWVVQTDITQFYASIYTHSLEWALVGKDQAKAALRGGRASLSPPDQALLEAGAGLDRQCRRAQDGQSVGIPAGPDASLILAELLMGHVDRKLVHRWGRKPRGFRHVDDYELGTASRSEAEELLAMLSELLQREAGLELNPRKTRILELPAPLERPWVTELKGVLRREDDGLGAHGRSQRRALLRLWDRAAALRAEHSGEHVFAYVAGILRGYTISDANWALLRDWMLHCILVEPACLPRFLADLLSYRAAGKDIALEDLRQNLTRLIAEHAPLAHSSEVLWSLWAHLELRLPVDPSLDRAIVEMADPCASLLALHLRAEGLWAPPDLSPWEALMEPEELWGEHWLLVAEARGRGWLPQGARDPLQEPGLGAMVRQGLSFYDPSARLDLRTLPTPPAYP